MEFRIIEHMSFDWRIALYLFIGGIAVGTYIFSIAANFWIKKFKPFARTAALAAPIFLTVALIILLLDLGQILRAWRLFVNFNPTSALSWGVLFLSTFFLISLIYAYYSLKGREAEVKILVYIGILFALLSATYAAVLLIQAPSRPLWHSSLLPVLFVNGGLISGIAVVILISAIRGESEKLPVPVLGKLLAWLLVFELSLLLTEFITLFHGGTEYTRMAQYITAGPYAYLFWLVEIGIGAVLPVVIFFFIKRQSPKILAVASLAALIGVFAMRFVIVVGGQLPTHLL